MFRIRVSDRRGFSLMELMVVLALVAAMSLVATPWFIKLYQRNQVKSAAREIQTTLLAARMKAVRRNQQVSVVISSSTPPIEFQTIEPAPPAPTPTPVPAVLQLPGRAVEFVTTPNAAGGMVTFGGDGRLVNFTAPTPAVFQLQGPVGKVMPTPLAIRVHSGGRVEVEMPKVWP
jgi:prepilin-type N-terminal cleavage/methylation domain-containing protein